MMMACSLKVSYALHYHLGSSDDHTVFEAEAVGLILTAKLIHSTPEITLPINIFMDNQATIISGQRPKSKPGHYILDKLRRLLLGIYRNHDITCKDICISWAPGHTGIIGNEKADKEARTAADSAANISKLALFHS